MENQSFRGKQGTEGGNVALNQPSACITASLMKYSQNNVAQSG